jgi:hypothetical protein
MIDRRMVVYGGIDDSGDYLRDVWVLDTSKKICYCLP